MHHEKSIVVSNLSFSYDQEQLFRQVSFSINEGEWFTIMGKSGSGKSTLLFLLSSLIDPKEGEIIVNGTNIACATRKELNNFRLNQIGIMFQDYSFLH